MTTPVLPVQTKFYGVDEKVALDVWAQIQRVQAGDIQAFDPIYRRYVDVVFRFVFFRVGARPLAEDICSETFAKALKGINSFTWQGRDFGAFLVTIARNLIADHFKSSKYRLEVTTGDVLDADREDPNGSPEASVLDYLSSVELLKAVKELNPDQQECVVLRFLRGLSTLETAEAMGKNEGAIKALQYRAVRSLFRLLNGESRPAPPPPPVERVEDLFPWPEPAVIRAWAAEQQIWVPPRGRVRAEVMEAYRLAVTPCR